MLCYPDGLVDIYEQHHEDGGRFRTEVERGKKLTMIVCCITIIALLYELIIIFE